MKKFMLMMKFILLLIICVQTASAQSNLFGSLRGQLVDKYSQSPIKDADVQIVGEPKTSAITDKNGYFIISQIPIGRVDILFSMLGYDSIYLPKIEISSSQQTELNISMEEKWNKLDDIVLAPAKKRSDLKSEFASVSAQTIDMKVANQFAGSLFDVARMATNLAGVISTKDDRNDIVIRGNSSTGVIWRINDLNVPNPNHFAGIGVTGGTVPLLNNMQIEEMAFYTAAFPSTFSNGISGVFDLQMKKGNTEKREHYFQIGFNGFELGSQGYFKKGARSSYMAAARISMFQVFQDVGILSDPKSFVPRYSDVSVKLDFPIAKRNQLSVFFIGGLNQIGFKGSLLNRGDRLQSSAVNTSMDLYNEGSLYMGGVSYKHYFSNNTFLKAILGATGQTFNSDLKSVSREIPDPGKVIYINDSIKQKLSRDNLQAHVFVNTKLSPLSMLRVGVIANTFFSKFSTKLYFLRNIAPEVEAGPNYEGNPSTLLQWYASYHRSLFEKKVDVNLGLSGMYFDLSNSVSPIEPRVGLTYHISSKHKISLAYGLHSQMQPITTYFFQDSLPGSKARVLKHDFTYSHHVAFSYQWSFWKSHSITIEPYYQSIYNVPSSKQSTFSMLNTGADFTIPVEFNLVNEGKGVNMGIELTWKSNYQKGFYHLFNLSLFKSEYTTPQGKTYPTIFDNGYVGNFLIGKEWNIFNNKFLLGGSTRLVYAGGLRYTDIIKSSSALQKRAVYDEANTNVLKMPDYFRWDIRIHIRHHMSKRFSQEFIVELNNVLNQQNAWLTSYNAITNNLDIIRQNGFQFIIFYRLYF